MTQQKIIPVILCGGSGTRLWPASRAAFPKQFLRLMGEASLLQQTMQRAMNVAGARADQIVTVTLGDLQNEVARQLGEIDADAILHILSEPSARNTSAAVALAAAYVAETFGDDALVWVLPADHHIADEKALTDALHAAIPVAQKDYLVTFGIEPTRPETGYGYIRNGTRMPDTAVYAVEQFVEKPNLEIARSYVESGDYLWNSGMFLFSAKAVLAQFEIHATPILIDVLKAMSLGSARLPDAALYNTIADQPFDKSIMEKSDLVAVVPCNPGWSDIGSWESLWELRKKDADGNATKGNVVLHDTQNCLIKAKTRLIGCAGINNLVIVETDDALLIADRTNSDAMKFLINALKTAGAPEVYDITPMLRHDVNGYQTSELTAEAKHSLFYEAHTDTLVVWTVLEGEGRLMIDGVATVLTTGTAATIPAGTAYFITAVGRQNLRILETRKLNQANRQTRNPSRKVA